MELWRIAKNTAQYPATDMSGGGVKTVSDTWLRQGVSVLLLMPSVIVPEGCNVLINAVHEAAGGCRGLQGGC